MSQKNAPDFFLWITNHIWIAISRKQSSISKLSGLFFGSYNLFYWSRTVESDVEVKKKGCEILLHKWRTISTPKKTSYREQPQWFDFLTWCYRFPLDHDSMPDFLRVAIYGEDCIHSRWSMNFSKSTHREQGLKWFLAVGCYLKPSICNWGLVRLNHPCR